MPSRSRRAHSYISRGATFLARSAVECPSRQQRRRGSNETLYVPLLADVFTRVGGQSARTGRVRRLWQCVDVVYSIAAPAVRTSYELGASRSPRRNLDPVLLVPEESESLHQPTRRGDGESLGVPISCPRRRQLLLAEAALASEETALRNAPEDRPDRTVVFPPFSRAPRIYNNTGGVNEVYSAGPGRFRGISGDSLEICMISSCFARNPTANFSAFGGCVAMLGLPRCRSLVRSVAAVSCRRAVERSFPGADPDKTVASPPSSCADACATAQAGCTPSAPSVRAVSRAIRATLSKTP